MKNLILIFLLLFSPLVLSGCYTIVDTGQSLSEEEITEIERDYDEEDYVQSYYSGNYFGGYSSYHGLPWWYSITPVTVGSSGSSDGTETESVVTRKRDKEKTNLRNRDGGRNSSGEYSGATTTRSGSGSSGGNSGSTTPTTTNSTAPATKSSNSDDSGSRSGNSGDNKNSSGRTNSGGGRK